MRNLIFRKNHRFFQEKQVTQEVYCMHVCLLIVFVSLLTQCTSPTPQQTDVKTFIASLPADERFFLDFFFRCLIQEDAIGYTLLEGKPMSFYSYLKPETAVASYHPINPIDFLFMKLEKDNALFHKGFEIWKKYESHFCGKNIYFDLVEEGNHFVYVCVFNKQLMLPLLKRHFQKFINFNHSAHNAESLFDLLLSDPEFKQKFYAREDLLGTFLGYGENNAELFQKRAKYLSALGRLSFTLDLPSPMRIQYLEKEIATIEKKFKGRIHNPLSRKFYFNRGVGFRADFSDPETLFLQKKYAGLHKKLTQIYSSTDFLEKTLEFIQSTDQDLL